MHPLKVYITVDTEFSVGNAFVEPETGQPVGPESVYCTVGGRSQGLGFMLDVLSEYRLSATFFVEALNTVWFGDEPMGRIAASLAESGHDVQLHMHPFWLYFRHRDWRARLSNVPPQDRTAGREPSELAGLIAMGLDAFRRWGLPRPTAFRSGGLDVDANVYRALSLCDLHVASNIGLAVYEPPDPSLHLVGGAHQIGDVTELPVLTYFAPGIRGRRSRKTLTITGSSWSEIRTLLRKAREHGYQQVVLLTHPFEFAKPGAATGTFRVNGINQRRFRRLCEFIAARPDEFQAAVMRDVFLEDLDLGPVEPLQVTLPQALGRMLVNRLNDTFPRL